MRRSVQEELRGRLQGVLGLAEDPGLVCMGLDTDYQLRAVQATGRRWARPVDGGQAGSLPPQPSPWDPPPQWDSALSSPQASCGWSRSFRMRIVGSDQGGLLTPDAGARTGGSGHMHVGEALSAGPWPGPSQWGLQPREPGSCLPALGVALRGMSPAGAGAPGAWGGPRGPAGGRERAGHGARASTLFHQPHGGAGGRGGH